MKFRFSNDFSQFNELQTENPESLSFLASSKIPVKKVDNQKTKTVVVKNKKMKRKYKLEKTMTPEWARVKAKNLMVYTSNDFKKFKNHKIYSTAVKRASAFVSSNESARANDFIQKSLEVTTAPMSRKSTIDSSETKKLITKRYQKSRNLNFSDYDHQLPVTFSYETDQDQSDEKSLSTTMSEESLQHIMLPKIEVNIRNLDKRIVF